RPDEIVKSQRLTAVQARLIDPIFHFTREVVNGRIAALPGYRIRPGSFGRRVTASDLPVTEGLYQEFVRYSAENVPALSAEALAGEADFVRLRLRYMIVMASFGAVSASQVLTEDDPQVAKAIESLPRAAALAELARRTTSGRK
ncbi:MAG: hypothetical protein AB7J13_16880, partial [Pyrinomonadaceae bacterium]